LVYTLHANRLAFMAILKTITYMMHTPTFSLMSRVMTSGLEPVSGVHMKAPMIIMKIKAMVASLKASRALSKRSSKGLKARSQKSRKSDIKS
jgi:hypothetical protein